MKALTKGRYLDGNMKVIITTTQKWISLNVLCEKYLTTKNKKYEIEIRKILKEFEVYDEIKNEPIDNICRAKETIFIYWYYE